jgi:TPR repeat protein
MLRTLTRLTLVFAALAAAAPAMAGECRGLVRPLLLAADPDAAGVEAARARCQAESAAGDAEATYQLALFSLGLAGRWEPDTAIPLVRQAAAAGVSEAQYWLGWQSESGPLLAHDEAVARGWYERAAVGRHRLALERLARAYEAGELGLTPDPQAALRLRAEIRRCAEERAAAGPAG